MEKILQRFIFDMSSRGIRESTIDFYRKYILQFCKFGKITYKDFGRRYKFFDAYQKIFERNISNNTKKKYLISARIFSDFLLKEKIIRVNYAREMKSPKIQKQLPCTMTREEIEEIHQIIDKQWSGYLKERNHMIIDILSYTGVRRAELADLKPEHIFDKKIYVREGKGGKDRIVFLPQHFSQKLQNFMKKYPGDFLLKTQKGERLKARSIHSVLHTIGRNLGKRIYPHLLRHSYATNCLVDGVDIYTLQQQLGHSDIKTTSIYLYLNDEMRYKKMQLLK